MIREWGRQRIRVCQKRVKAMTMPIFGFQRKEGVLAFHKYLTSNRVQIAIGIIL